MSIFEIIAGVILILACVVVIGIVLSQESKGQGLSSVITGTEMMSGESRVHSKEARKTKITRIADVVLFVLTMVVNVASGLAK